MSSLAAARADNFYYPPDYRREHGSLNQYRKSHPLGKRAKRISEGILTIRFEMPYKAFCTQCHQVIAKGVRFNAEKKCVGMYFSTKILEFKMTCCFCPNIFRIRTNPQECDYTVVEGLWRKTETFSKEDCQTLEFRSVEERHAIESDPVLKLETSLEDTEKAQEVVCELEALIKTQQDKFSDGRDYTSNANLRRCFRKQTQALMKENQQKDNFVLPLPSATREDFCEASSVHYYTKRYAPQLCRRLRSVNAQASSLFGSPETKCTASNTTSGHPNSHQNQTARGKKKKKLEKVIPTDHPALVQVIRVPEKSKTLHTKSHHQKQVHVLNKLEQLSFAQRIARRHPIMHITSP